MEPRKNPKLDLDKKRSLHFNIGLALTMALILSAFEWKSDFKKLITDPSSLYDKDVFIEVDPPLTTFPPPIKPVVVQPIVIPVPDDEEIKEEVEEVFDPEDILVEELIIDIPEPEPEKAPTVFTIVEQKPEPVGGMSAFYKFLGKHIKYPNQARRMRIEGRVFVQFIVDQTGKITEIKTIKGIGGGCDEEAERILALVPRWNPGKQRGRAVNVRLIVPITFSLN